MTLIKSLMLALARGQVSVMVLLCLDKGLSGELAMVKMSIFGLILGLAVVLFVIKLLIPPWLKMSSWFRIFCWIMTGMLCCSTLAYLLM